MKVVYCAEIEEGVTIALDDTLIVGTKVEIGIGVEAKRAII